MSLSSHGEVKNFVKALFLTSMFYTPLDCIGNFLSHWQPMMNSLAVESSPLMVKKRERKEQQKNPRGESGI